MKIKETLKAKLILGVSMLLLFAANVSTATAQISYGIKGGMSVNNMYFDKDDNGYDMKTRSGFFVGPTIKLALPLGGLGLDLAALYQQRSVKQRTPGVLGGPTFVTCIKQQQIAIPLNVRYDYDISNDWGVFAFVGPQLNFSVGKEFHLDYGDYVPKGTALDLNFGVGATILKHLQISAGYTIPCSKTGEIWIGRQTKGGGKQIDDAYMRGWQFSVGYYL